ncbi:hypothetical protein F3J45_28330 [Pantoea sp. Ap-967]|uniref:hypothetical protein n=1 Tax=Pantoea sp. Ap-967 TaxID=2608362 RepID=UPI00141F7B13|nr:hypothetical protein [Pantoea sp. Ap-967]NIE78338.1 hypothetical protein [Pantoea sp. Ap-967]
MERKIAAYAVHWVGLVAMLALFWQAVRFVMGDIGNPLNPVFEFVRHGAGIAGPVPTLSSWGPFDGLLDGYQRLMMWCFGVMAWMLAALLVGHASREVARMILVGWTQYQTERKEERKAARIAATRQAAKDRRRELRRKVLEAQQPRPKSSGILPFIVGALFGSFFL